jgi:hypothetical protein
MSAEALSRGIVEAEAAMSNMTPRNLAKQRKVASARVLYKLAREEAIFASDPHALSALENASDGFEHGYMPLPEVRSLAEPVLERAARHVRRALISVLQIVEDVASQLLKPELDEPRGLTPPMKILRGELQINDPMSVFSKVDDAVEMDWETPRERQIERNAQGNLTITGTTKATILGLPAGVGLVVGSSGMRVEGAVDYRVGEVVVRRATPESD